MDFTILEARSFTSTCGSFVRREVKDYEIDLECGDNRLYAYDSERAARLHTGDILVRRPHGVVTASGLQSSYMLTLDFSKRAEPERYSRNTPGPFQPPCDAEILASLDAVIHPVRTNDFGGIYRQLILLPRRSPAAKALVRELLFLLNAEAARKNYEELKPAQTVSDSLIAFMQAHLSEHLTLDDLAKEVCLEKSYLLRQFRKETGRTPMETLIAMRLEKASDLVASTELGIMEIAAACGYRSSSFFISSYKKRYDISPEAHRRLLRQARKNRT